MTISLQPLTRRPRLVAPVLAVAVLALVWWFAWMRPTGAKLASATEQRTSDVASIASLQQRLVQLRADARHETSARNFVHRFAAEIPPSADAPQLVSQIYALAVRSSVKLNAITDDTVVRSAADYSTIPVSLNVSGSQPGIVAFVDGLYTLPRLVTVQQLQLVGPATGNVITGGMRGYSAAITATAYTTSLDATPATGTTPATTAG